MDLLSSKNIVIILLCIIVVSCLGLGYLEIKTIKSKLIILENSLTDKNKGLNNKIPDTNNTNNTQNIVKKMCMICNRVEVSPSSSSKYHNKYCVNCATIDYNNNIKVQQYMDSNKQSTINIESNTNNLKKKELNIQHVENIVEEEKEEKEEKGEEEKGEEYKEEEEKEEKEEKEEVHTRILDITEEDEVELEEIKKEVDIIEEVNTFGFNKQISEDLNKIKLDILRNLLKENNISHSGNKQIIIGRIIKNNIQTKHLFE
jgi:hypothetical protein